MSILFLEIVFSHDFDPTIFDCFNCRTQGNVITARGTMDELNVIIQASDNVLGDRTIIIRRGNNEKNEKTQT